MTRLTRVVRGVLAVVFACGAVASTEESTASVDPGQVIAAIDATVLDFDRAVAVKGLRLAASSARILLQEGIVVPAAPVSGRPAELVFVGRGELSLSSPDPIEAAQLELFAGTEELSEPFDTAVLVVAVDRAVDAILTRPKAPDLAPGDAERVRNLFLSWRRGAVRELLDVDRAVLGDALGDPSWTAYFAALVRGEQLGDFVFVFDPSAREQVTLGAFTPVELDNKARRKVERRLAQEQRRGRLIGVSVDDLGQWDTWVSEPMRDSAGRLVPGRPAFAPQHYQLAVTVPRKDVEVEVEADIRLLSTGGGRRVVPLSLHTDAQVSRVTDGDGKDLFHLRRGDDLTVVLPAPPGAGEEVEVRVSYRGVLLFKGDGGTYALRDALTWLPRVDSMGQATYDTTLRWPDSLDLVASGRLVEAGREDGSRWERRVLTVPTAAFAFQLGSYDLEQLEVGHVHATVAFDGRGRGLDAQVRDDVVAAVRDALLYFEEVFGAYPLDELTVVTGPQDFSQSLLGYVSLSRNQVLDYSIWALLAGIEDRRTVVAHEVAHQWWGHLVPWGSYRDQWISEAMANYSSLLFGRNRLDWEGRNRVDATHRWQSLLTDTLDDGRPVESLGPLVLGLRLASSKSADAYESIVYKKGAVVLNMLAMNFGEERFLGLLKGVVDANRFREVSTETFLSALEELSGEDLDRFAAQYIFGTGLPELDYTYEFSEKGEGRWAVRGSVHQQSPYRYRYAVTGLADGRLDVHREAVEQVQTSRWFLVVPIRIAAYDPSRDEGGKGRTRSRKDRVAETPPANVHVSGRLFLKGDNDQFELELAYEPKDLWFDPDQQVFCRFFDRERHPKRGHLLRAYEQQAAGRREEAEASFRAALATAARGGRLPEGWDDEDLEREAVVLDGLARLGLARVLLDRGDLLGAAAELESCRRSGGRSERWLLEGELAVLESRAEILRGEFEPAFKRLRRGLLRREELDDTEAYLLLAIAAQRTDHPKELARALEAVKDRGVDLGVLAQ